MGSMGVQKAKIGPENSRRNTVVFMETSPICRIFMRSLPGRICGLAPQMRDFGAYVRLQGAGLNRRKPETERRKWTRLPLAIPVFVRSRDEKGKEFLEFATALNISAGGALVAVRRSSPLSPKESVPSLAKTLRVAHLDSGRSWRGGHRQQDGPPSGAPALRSAFAVLKRIFPALRWLVMKDGYSSRWPVKFSSS